MPTGTAIAMIWTEPFAALTPVRFKNEVSPTKMPSSEEIIKKAADNAPDAFIPSACSNTVLLVEDDYSIRRYLEVVLQRAGYDVVTASDGLGAMKSALSNSIDVVITDAI